MALTKRDCIGPRTYRNSFAVARMFAVLQSQPSPTARWISRLLVGAGGCLRGGQEGGAARRPAGHRGVEHEDHEARDGPLSEAGIQGPSTLGRG